MSWKDAYLENQVMTADPLELVRMLYQAALDSVRDARNYLATGEIKLRSNAISRAQSMIEELNVSLDPNAGDISRNLASLYIYMRQRLTEANLRQKDAPLAEVEGLLATLYDAWMQIGTPAMQPAETAVPAGPVREWSSAFASNEAHAWSA